MTNVITISRQFGSGGREIGKKLAEKLGYEYYDKQVVTGIVSKTDLCNEFVEGVLEGKVKESFIFATENSFDMAMSYQSMEIVEVHQAQTKVIKEMAEKSNCVIVGRCADYILADNENINLNRLFIYADMDSRVERCMERNKDAQLTPKQMAKEIKKIDKDREHYYSRFTGNDWGDIENFDFCINTSRSDIDAIVEAIAKVAE